MTVYHNLLFTPKIGPEWVCYKIWGWWGNILSGVSVGENCLLSVNSVVKNNLPDYSLAMGYPAKQIIDIRKFIILGKGKMYPWMYRYSIGMPWENIGYEKWMNNENEKI